MNKQNLIGFIVAELTAAALLLVFINNEQALIMPITMLWMGEGFIVTPFLKEPTRTHYQLGWLLGVAVSVLLLMAIFGILMA